MLEDFTREYAEFNAALILETYLFHSGQKAQLELRPIYERYGDLFTFDSVARLKAQVEETPGHFEAKRASLRRLFAFAIDQFLASSVKSLTEAIGEYESKATVDWSARRMTFHDCSIELTSEPNREARRLLFERRARVIKDSNDLRAERIVKLHEAVGSLATANGNEEAADYRGLYEGLQQLDFDSLRVEAERLLEQTEAVYVARLDEALKRDIGIGIDEAERHDAIYLLHLDRYRDRFPLEGLRGVYKRTMAGLGIEIDSQSNIEIDSEARPHKTPRAFCAPILVPEQIKLVMRPVGGRSDYLTFLHEAGHAQHYGWTSPSLSPEFKYTGDYALSETYAFLFNHLPAEGEWLRTLLGFDDCRDLICCMMLTKLAAVRRYAAKFLFECQLHTKRDLTGAPAVYAKLQTKATKCRTDETEFLFDLDDSFYSASYLRAWAFEVMLREYLKTRFGSTWWSSRRAGSFMKEIWETGDRYNADEMAGQIGIGPISMTPLVDEFMDRFAHKSR